MSTRPQNPSLERFYPDRVAGAHVIAFEAVESTMDIASEIARAGGAHGTVVRAGVQRKGRGRFARRWDSAPDDSLLTSTILRMPPLDIGAPISIAGAVAVHDTVRELLGISCGLKWPNDVHVNGMKIAGVLTESQVMTDGTGFAVLGVGLNVNLSPESFAGIAETATSLARVSGELLDLDRVEETMFRRLDEVLSAMSDDAAKLIQRWKTLLTTIGKRVELSTRNGALIGVAENVDSQGALLLRTADGTVHRMFEGDVTLQG